MEIQIPNELREMIGLKCCTAKLALDNGLRIEFGNKVLHYHSKLLNKDMFHGEWSLLSTWSSWRVVKNNTIVCSAYDDEEFIESLIKSLLDSKLQNIIQCSNFDFSLVFDNGLTVEFFGVSDINYAVEVKCKDGDFFEFKASHGWTKVASTVCEELTRDEAILAKHSEKFNQRWENYIPKGETPSLYRMRIFRTANRKISFLGLWIM